MPERPLRGQDEVPRIYRAFRPPTSTGILTPTTFPTIPVAGRWPAAIHGFVLERLCPKPDLVVWAGVHLLAVVAVNRSLLDMPGTFPELAPAPLVGRWLVPRRTAARRTVEARNP